jgi:hypothetical protein
MTAAVKTSPDLTSRLVNRILAIKPLYSLAKHQARQMMIKRAEKIGRTLEQRSRDTKSA